MHSRKVFPCCASASRRLLRLTRRVFLTSLGTLSKQQSRCRPPGLLQRCFSIAAINFEPVLLPPEAQFAPAFGVVVADFDGDGNEIFFSAKTFFLLQPTTARLMPVAA